MIESLAESRRSGLDDFEDAWLVAMARLRADPWSRRSFADVEVGLLHAKQAFRRAYYGEPQTRGDSAAQALWEAMVNLYDWSGDAEATDYSELMAA